MKNTRQKKTENSGKYFKCATDGRVLAKLVDGRLVYAHKVTTNSYEALQSWQEYESLKSASEKLGAPMPQNVGCPILEKKHAPINWSKFRGGYYIPFSTLE